MKEPPNNPRRASRLVLLPYALTLFGAAAGITAHIAFARHYQPYHPSIPSVLFTILPFILTAAVAYAVRQFRFSCAAVAFVTVILLLMCLQYTGVTDDDEQPFFILGFIPFFQLFVVVAFLTPVLTGAWFAHQRRHTQSPTSLTVAPQDVVRSNSEFGGKR